MQKANEILDIYRKRGAKGLPLERVYRQLFNPELFLLAYNKIYRNAGAMTKGIDGETVDGMNTKKIHDIIDLIKQEKYEWSPARKTEILKENGRRSLSISTWRDKLVQEALRTLLSSYYEPKFNDHSHGFRPGRNCHSALLDVRSYSWRGTTWFIEGDIKECFSNIDHSILLNIIKKDIKDGRIVNLIDGLLKAGYMDGWKYNNSTSGVPQGGIISPLLSNIYLNELDKFISGTLIPEYTRGDERQRNPAYRAIEKKIGKARKAGDRETLKRLKKEQRTLNYSKPIDPNYRRLRFVRYADDFLIGFTGPKTEAEKIKERLSEFLGKNLKLTLSPDKTFITHANDGKALFLGYEITVTRCGDLLSKNGIRSTNGGIALLMPQKVVFEYRKKYSKNGKVIHKAELLKETEYTIVSKYQSVLRGLYNYYCLATNVSDRVATIKWYLETSLTKTLAHKLKCSVTKIFRKFQTTKNGLKVLRIVHKRQGKTPLIAIFGGFSLVNG